MCKYKLIAITSFYTSLFVMFIYNCGLIITYIKLIKLKEKLLHMTSKKGHSIV